MVSGTQPIADVYAEALLDVAADNALGDRIVEDAALIGESLRRAPELLAWLSMPSIACSAKIAILERAFEGRVHKFTMRLVEMMVQRGRTKQLSDLYNAVRRIRKRREEIIEVVVKSARPIDDEQKPLFQEKIRRTFGEASSVSYTTDTGLLGGFQIISRERKIDHSIRMSLSQLKKRLLHS